MTPNQQKAQKILAQRNEADKLLIIEEEGCCCDYDSKKGTREIEDAIKKGEERFKQIFPFFLGGGGGPISVPFSLAKTWQLLPISEKILVVCTKKTN